MNYQGVIIAESLDDNSVLKDVRILNTKIEEVTPDHQTPYLKQWTLHTVEIPEDKVDEVAERISKSFDKEHLDWYADFKNDKCHYIIYPNKIFKVNLNRPEQYQAATDYGVSIGIPKHQVNFTPNTKDRPTTTLFLLQSLDGKITTGDIDDLDIDTDFKRIKGLKEGLQQYYDIEKTTDIFSLNSGRVMTKIGVNERTKEPAKVAVNFIIIDNKPHLTEKGVEYMTKWGKFLYLVTTNKNHPAFKLKKGLPIEVIYYENEIDLADLLKKMKQQYNANGITIQTGGTLNAEWVRQGLIDNVSIVIAPCLIGGANTQSLLGGESLHTLEDLKKIKVLKLIKNETLKDSYIHLQYKVINETELG